MTQKLNFLLVLFITGQSLFAQQNLPIIRATSKIVDIRDGDDFQKANWTISPKLKPDIYQTNNKKVTFYTDLDSITFKVKPNQKYSFHFTQWERFRVYSNCLFPKLFRHFEKGIQIQP